MLQRFISVLIIAKPGSFRDGLTALVSAIPHVDRIYQESGAAAALKRGVQACPALVIWDIDLPEEEAASWLSLFKDQCPDAVCLLLITHASQEKLMAHARADALLLKGVHADKLLSTLEALLSRRSS